MGAYWHPCSGYGNILRILLFGPRNGTAVLKGLSNIKEWFDRTVVRTGSGQCQVAQEKGNAELQFSVFVSALIHPQLLCHFFATSIRSFSESLKTKNRNHRRRIMGQEIIDTIDLGA